MMTIVTVATAEFEYTTYYYLVIGIDRSKTKSSQNYSYLLPVAYYLLGFYLHYLIVLDSGRYIYLYVLRIWNKMLHVYGLVIGILFMLKEKSADIN